MISRFIDYIKKNKYLVIIFIGVILRLVWIFAMPTYPETDFMWYHVRERKLLKEKDF